MSNPKLFEPLEMNGLRLRNRIVIAPMCQYSAEHGVMNDWHKIHLGSLAQSGAALLTIEATAVTPEGRISYGDVGLFDDQSEAAIADVLNSIRRWSNMPVAIQLSHAGRKSSSEVPWKGGAQISPDNALGWQTVAPSAVAYLDSYVAPTTMDKIDLMRVRNAFAEAAARAHRLGLDAVQIHAAHGYLLHQFLSPRSNLRSDEYGGSLANRLRFPLDVFDAMRASFPDRPLTVRVSATDWVQGGWDLEQTIRFAQELEGRGCDAVHVSSGGLASDQQIPVSPGYQVPFARAVKQSVKVPVVAVGLITGYDQAEAILQAGDADAIALARAILYEPHWPWHAAAHLGGQVDAPAQYHRSQPREFKNLFNTLRG